MAYGEPTPQQVQAEITHVEGLIQQSKANKGGLLAAKATSAPPDPSKDTASKPADATVELLPIVSIDGVSDKHAVSPTVMQKGVEFLREIGAQHADAQMATDIMEGKVTVSPEQAVKAGQLRAQALSDRTFREAYLSGDATALAYMMCLNAAINCAAPLPKKG
jgi:hypothetical protein